MIHRYLLPLLLLAAACSSRSDDALSNEDALAALPSLDHAKLMDERAYGAPTSAPIDVAEQDVIAIPFTGAMGDRVLISIRAEVLSPAIPDIWIIDAANNVVGGSSAKAFVDTKLPSSGAFRIIFRESQQRRGRFTVALNAFVPTNDVRSVDWFMPATGGESMKTVFAVGENEAWAAGEQGTLLHYVGEKLVRVDTGVTDTLTEIWASSPRDVWAAGGSTLLHFDGASWFRMPRSFKTTSLAGTNAKDVWLLEAGDDQSTISRWDGERWSSRKGAFTHHASTLVVRSSSDAWIFGHDYDTAAAFHWNGLEWSPGYELDRDASVSAVTTLSNGNIVAVGGFSARDLLWQWSGSSWDNFSDDGLYGGYNRATSIWGTSTDDLWAITGNRLYQKKYQWELSKRETPDYTGATAYANAVHGVVAGAPFATGDGGQVWHREGDAWRTLGERALSCGNAPVTGPAADLWIPCGREIVRGMEWKRETFDAEAGIVGLWAETSDRATVATTKNTLVQIDAKGSHVIAQAPTSLRAIWASSNSDVWLATTEGKVLRWDGVTFTTVAGTPPWVRAIVGSSKDDVYAVTSDAKVSHFDGTSWTALPASGQRSLTSARFEGGELRLTGSEGLVAFRDGAWKSLASGNLTDAIVDANDVVIKTDRGLLVRNGSGYLIAAGNGLIRKR